MERYRQQSPKLIAMEDWLAKAHPGAPGLPWVGDDGREVCSFAMLPLDQTDGIQIVLFDAHGREVVMSGAVQEVKATATALGAKPGELVFLPKAGDPRAAKVDPEALPRSMEGEGLTIAPFYTEAGYFREANVVRITDGERTALYEPFKVVKD